jgi:hypothetical protein
MNRGDSGGASRYRLSVCAKGGIQNRAMPRAFGLRAPPMLAFAEKAVLRGIALKRASSNQRASPRQDIDSRNSTNAAMR